MRAVVHDVYGPPDVIRVDDVPVPTVGPGEVLVRVRASSVNDYDVHLLTGEPKVNRIQGARRPRHRGLGSDVAGEVAELGDGVVGLAVGDAVWGDLSGCGFAAFAEYAVAPRTALAPMPRSLTFEQAGAVPQAAALAMAGVRGRLPLEPGARVLLNGAGGGVGTFALQLVKRFGAEVVAVDLGRKLDRLRELGADVVVDYETDDVAVTGGTFDLVVDVHADRSVSRRLGMLRPGGLYSVIGGPVPRVLSDFVVAPLASAGRGRRVVVPRWRPNDDRETAALTVLVDEGHVRPVVDSVFPLDEVPDAFRRVIAQEHVGKVVIAI